MKRPPATENSDCVLSHLLERSPLMRESAAQCYNHRLAYNLGKNATVGSTVVCKHLRTSGIGCSLRENLGGAAIICGASQSNNSLSCSQTDRYSFFFRTRMLTRAFRSVSVNRGGRIDLATLVGSQSLRVPHRSTGRIWCK